MNERPYVQIADKYLSELRALLNRLNIEYPEYPIAKSLQKGLDLTNNISAAIQRDNNH